MDPLSGNPGSASAAVLTSQYTKHNITQFTLVNAEIRLSDLKAYHRNLRIKSYTKKHFYKLYHGTKKKRKKEYSHYTKDTRKFKRRNYILTRKYVQETFTPSTKVVYVFKHESYLNIYYFGIVR